MNGRDQRRELVEPELVQTNIRGENRGGGSRSSDADGGSSGILALHVG
jgi:hypothetical protein